MPQIAAIASTQWEVPIVQCICTVFRLFAHTLKSLSRPPTRPSISTIVQSLFSPSHVTAMGWFDGWFGSSPSQDPFRKLDPKLRELLEKESPVKYTPQSDDAPPAHHGAPAAAPPVAAADPNEPAVPRQSLFPDGRYAHLWKTYRDQGAVEAETKTASEKVEDMLEAYKERNYNIGRAALENCALEQEEWVNCLKTGDWADRLQMCRHQVRRFERCYVMQSVRPPTLHPQALSIAPYLII